MIQGGGEGFPLRGRFAFDGDAGERVSPERMRAFANGVETPPLDIVLQVLARASDADE